MNDKRNGSFEYPDEAGYPDGTGTLDEGTAGAGEEEDAGQARPEEADGAAGGGEGDSQGW
ncbi:hypothetical protein [Glaciibacter sp. 2TAF33]|uniref:hypothetical protein n=1 Tax=Glaciibacter sp. 2TAF33 TaxID=3233015 RepID=UPI003F8D9AD4